MKLYLEDIKKVYEDYNVECDENYDPFDKVNEIYNFDLPNELFSDSSLNVNTNKTNDFIF